MRVLNAPTLIVTTSFANWPRPCRCCGSAYGVTGLSVFGSVIRGEAHAGSDVDILVEFEHPIDLFRFDDLEREMEALLGQEVDLVEPAALHPALRASILAEAQPAA